jgi:hypothetical protein
MNKTNYSTKMAEKQYEIIKNFCKTKIRRHRHLLREIINTLSLLIVVCAINQHDSENTIEVIEVIEPLKYRFDRMKKIYADGDIVEDSMKI